MKFKDKHNVSPEFEDLFSFENDKEELNFEAQILMFKFLEQLENSASSGGKFKRKDLAGAIGKSRSFISQLYSGDKLISFALLAKIQKAFDITFDIKAHVNSTEYKGVQSNLNVPNIHEEQDGFWVWKNKNPDYSAPDESINTYNFMTVNSLEHKYESA